MKRPVFRHFALFLLACAWVPVAAQPIDRKKLVERHSVINTGFDSLSSLSVGNGQFCFTVDATGLQSFPEYYANGVPLGTQSEWGWHSFPNTENYRFDETLKNYHLNGRDVSYSVQVKEPEHAKAAVNWFRQNPQRLHLANIGFVISKTDGSPATVEDISDVRQTLNMWTGEIHSRFRVEGKAVDVVTYCHGTQDAISVRISSPLLGNKQLRVRIRFPYPNGEWKDVGTNWQPALDRSSVLINNGNSALIRQSIDSTEYYVAIGWKGRASLGSTTGHEYILSTSNEDKLEFSCRFSPRKSPLPLPGFQQTASGSRDFWRNFWQSGGAVDFSGTADRRAFELERRIILSQYLTRIQCAGNLPPQETGLTYNSWFGKPHLEMHWWHGVHFALWGRPQLLEKSLSWYGKVAGNAKKIAERQGYDGLRWQKMTDPDGNESPSSVGAFLVWQQPHFIYFSELVYRSRPNKQTIDKYRDLVFSTADFMASYAYYDTLKKRYILGKGLIAAQERFKAEETFNPTYELVYWHWALNVAQRWRERAGLPRNKKWDDVIEGLSELPVQDGKYLFTESATDSYTNPEFRTDHPSVLGAWGMLPKTPMMDSMTMVRTFDWISQNWSWRDTWGWDFPMTAMTATRLGMRDRAIEALLMPVKTNTYLRNGHNYQDDRLTLYLPGNGGLLAAIAMMCAGTEENRKNNPGIPAGWKVKWEGLKKMF